MSQTTVFKEDQVLTFQRCRKRKINFSQKNFGFIKYIFWEPFKVTEDVLGRQKGLVDGDVLEPHLWPCKSFIRKTRIIASNISAAGLPIKCWQRTDTFIHPFLKCFCHLGTACLVAFLQKDFSWNKNYFFVRIQLLGFTF